ncbi:MAG: thymidylate synthase [Gloeomargaritaceae cyanobacterium C42_A2020_066]|nr:thymidylate synthase [Gloeomargaritaceae cyanobacterium C42_A2020_066]
MTDPGCHYRPLYKPNQLICGTGHTVIITGWTVKEMVAKRLEPQDYAAIGQLYSPTRGIDFLVRNLLFNPYITHLVLLQATREDRNAGGCQCFADFFAYGVEAGQSDTGRPCWVIRSSIVGTIDPEVPLEALETLRQSVTWSVAGSIQEAIDQTIAAAGRPVIPWAEPQTFPKQEPQSQTLPGPRYGHRLHGRTIAETWVKILHRIRTTGTVRPTGYDGQWQELIDLTAVITDEPRGFYFPDPNYLPVTPDFIQEYLPQILADAPYREGVKYTYGQRLRSWFGEDQIEQVIHKLCQEIDAASAVMSLWDVRDHHKGGSPCLNHLWVRVVAGELSLTAVLRSNDMFAAWPANAMGLRALQEHIFEQVSLRADYTLTLGPLVTLSQSAHIYDDTWENVDLLLRRVYPDILRQRDYSDPAGSFLVSLDEQGIRVEHLTPGTGEVVQVFCGRRAQELYRQIAAACPMLEAEHALYLGTELQKAETASLHPDHWHYSQDRPLQSLATVGPNPKS